MPAELLSEHSATLVRPVRAPAGVRLRAEWRLKLGLYVVLSVAFCAAYYLVGNYPLRTPTVLPMTAVDRAVGFDPRWVWVYESVFMLIPLGAMLATRRTELLTYARAFVVLSVFGVAFFVVFPTQCPRPAGYVGGAYAVMAAIDPATYAFPSMHVALALQSVLFGGTVLRGARGVAWRVCAGVWLLLIAYATLATKQHYAVDLLAGAAAAGAVHLVLIRRRVA